MNDRTCIASRQRRDPEELIRFVVGPDGSIVPDLKRNLPGRGCWVTADRLHVGLAAKKNLFSRAFRRQVTVADDLPDVVDALLARSALGLLGLARKSGSVGLGATKVEALVRSGEAIAVLHAAEAAEDGVRKIAQARRAVAHMGGPHIPGFKLFPETELGLALGGTNVIHAAVLAKDAGAAAVRRLHALDRYRGGSPDEEAMFAAIAELPQAAEDQE